MPRKKRRFSRPGQIIGFKAFQGDDDDILSWWNHHLEPSKRSQALRVVIREYLRASDSEESDPSREMQELKAMIAELGNQVANLSRKIERGVAPSNSNGHLPPDASGSSNEYRRNVLKQKW